LIHHAQPEPITGLPQHSQIEGWVQVVLHLHFDITDVGEWAQVTFTHIHHGIDFRQFAQQPAEAVHSHQYGIGQTKIQINTNTGVIKMQAHPEGQLVADGERHGGRKIREMG
tara:strand:- start:131907 stop:132242 length:336 start_codon:yes stop_codon:yes gene_type:complete